MKKFGLISIALAILLTLVPGCQSNNSTQGSNGTNGAKLSAEAFPTKDVTVIVPYGAGGTTDLCVRGVLDAVDSQRFSKHFIVSNITGGSGLIGSTQFAHAKPDGYTLGVLNCDLVLNSVNGTTPLKPEQFTPLACIENDPYLLIVKKGAPYSTLQEFVEYAKAHPGEIAIGDTGVGTAPHLAYLALEQKLGLKFKTVSYDSAADSVVSVVSGECQAVITASGAAMGQLKSGAITALAVTSDERLKTFPEVPAMGELYDELKEVRINSWIMLALSAEVPENICQYFNDLLVPAAGSEQYRKTQEGFSFQPVSKLSLEEMKKFISDQQALYQSLLKQ